MNSTDEGLNSDRVAMQQWMANVPDTRAVAGFVAGPGIARLSLTFDIEALRQALQEALQHNDFAADDYGFGGFPLMRRPGVEQETPNDRSGLFYTRVDDSYTEVQREDCLLYTSPSPRD